MPRIRLLLLLLLLPLSVHAEDSMQSERPLLLAHFMPWYQAPNVSGYWGWHWTMDHFDPTQTEADGRPQLASHYMPLTGAYDSQDDAILEYQTLLMKLSGIDGVIVDWYGASDFYDYGLSNRATMKLFDAVTRAGLKFVICYEDRTIRALIDGGHLTTETAISRGQDDMQFAAEHWFGHDAYVKFNGQPLVFVFGPLYFRQGEQWTEIFAGIEPTPALVTLDNNLSFGSLTNYPWPPMHMSGGIELPQASLNSYLERFYRNAQRRDLVVGSAFPAFHDIYAQAGVRASYGSIAHRDGATFRETLALALENNAQIVQLVTWNDYGEGTIIEPTEESGYQYLEIVQETRHSLDPAFTPDAAALRLPLRLLELRRAHPGGTELGAQLDRAYAALIAGDTAAGQALLDAVP
jgi:hypothetical protein